MLELILAVGLADLVGLVAVCVGFLLLVVVLLMSSSSSVKSKTVEGRIGNVVLGVGVQTGRIDNLSGQSTSTARPAGVPTGGPSPSLTADGNNGGITSGQIGSGSSHYHAMSHEHDMSSHGHDFDGHTHYLPSV
jgi:hypothetical protein